MNKPRFSFYYDEKPFWRLIFFLIVLFIVVAVTGGVGEAFSTGSYLSWHNWTGSTHATIATDYQRRINVSSHPPLRSDLLVEIQNGQ